MKNQIEINWQKIFKQLDNGEMSKEEYFSTYNLIFTICSSRDFDKYKNKNHFFSSFIQEVRKWIQKTSNHVNIKLELPWQIICEHLKITDLLKLKMVNQEFNEGIQINLFNKLKALPNLLNYFQRISFRNGPTAKALLQSQGLENIYSENLTIKELLFRLVYINEYY